MTELTGLHKADGSLNDGRYISELEGDQKIVFWVHNIGTRSPSLRNEIYRRQRVAIPKVAIGLLANNSFIWSASFEHATLVKAAEVNEKDLTNRVQFRSDDFGKFKLWISIITIDLDSTKRLVKFLDMSGIHTSVPVEIRKLERPVLNNFEVNNYYPRTIFNGKLSEVADI